MILEVLSWTSRTAAGDAHSAKSSCIFGWHGGIGGGERQVLYALRKPRPSLQSRAPSHAKVSPVTFHKHEINFYLTPPLHFHLQGIRAFARPKIDKDKEILERA